MAWAKVGIIDVSISLARKRENPFVGGALIDQKIVHLGITIHSHSCPCEWDMA